MGQGRGGEGGCEAWECGDALQGRGKGKGDVHSKENEGGGRAGSGNEGLHDFGSCGNVRGRGGMGREAAGRGSQAGEEDG